MKKADPDYDYYRREIAPSLPPVVLDFHTHAWSADNWKERPWATDKSGGRYMVTDEFYPPEQLLADGRAAFPDRVYEAVCFGYPTPAVDWEKDTTYVAAAARAHRGLWPLLLGGPALGVSRERYEQALVTGRFHGFKVFLNWYGDDYGNLRVEEMFGPAELGLANERRLVVLLHVPRRGRLADPEHRKNVMKFCPRYGTAITETLFMTSRDGRTFHRWGEAFIRPGIERKHNWVYGDGYIGWGLVETPAEDPFAPPEYSLYVPENYQKPSARLRRYTMRLDGFVSLNAPLKGGEVLSKPLIFSGKKLTLNFSSSAAGSIRVELLDAEGKPLPGYALADCDEVFGDSLERTVTWKGKPDIGQFAGQSVRLRFAMKDADLYALRFQ